MYYWSRTIAVVNE